MKKQSWLTGLIILAAACGGGDKKADLNPIVTAKDQTYNSDGSNGDNAGPAEFLVTKDDGLFYAAKSVSDIPFSGKIKETSLTGGSLSVKVYKNGVLRSPTNPFLALPGPGGDTNGDDASLVKFLVKKDDGLFYAAKSVSDLSYSGKMEERSRTDGSLSVKVYQDGVLRSVDEYFSGTEQKKSSTTFDELGQVQKKEDWMLDGTKGKNVMGVIGQPIAIRQPTKGIKGKSVMWKTYGGAHQNIFSRFKGKSYKTMEDIFGLPDREKKETKLGIDIIWLHYSGVHIVDLDRSKAQGVMFKIYRYKSGETSIDEIKLDTSTMLLARDRLVKYALGKRGKSLQLRGLLSTTKQRILKKRIVTRGRVYEEFEDRTLYSYGRITWSPEFNKHDSGVTITANEKDVVIDVTFR